MSNTTRQSVAWLVLDRDGSVWDFFTDDDAARKCAMKLDGTCVPLYRDPPPATLTDEERKLLQKLETSGSLDGFMLSDKHRKTLRRLLARH